MSNTSINMKSRAVCFSDYSELYIVPTPADTSSTYYSSQDKKRFRRSMVACIRELSQEIEALPTGATMTQEQLIHCLGIELFITKGSARCATEARRAHIDAVLTEQSRQKHSGTCDIERLSITSQKGSLWSKERAQKLAMGYASLIC